MKKLKSVDSAGIVPPFAMNSVMPAITLVVDAKPDVIEKFLEYKSEYIQEFFNEFFAGVESPAKKSWIKAVLYMYGVIMNGILRENALYDDVYLAFWNFYRDTREYYSGDLKDATDDFFMRVCELVEIQPVKVCYSRPPAPCDLPDPSELFV
jgi:hypothetical protein